MDKEKQSLQSVRRLTIIAAATLTLVFYPVSRATPDTDERLSLIFLGDTNFGESYLEEVEKYGGENILKSRGYGYSINHFSNLLQEADFVIGSLETSLAALKSSPLADRKPYLHRSDPVETVKALKEHNFSAVSLANNHSMDYGVIGLQQTLDALQAQGIKSFGAGENESAARKPIILKRLLSGRVFSFIVAAGFEYRRKYNDIYSFYAGKTKSGVNAWTLDRAIEQISKIREKYPNAFLIAYPHFGENYKWKTKEQTTLAHALIDAGADLVIGHGAHMLQEIEQYGEGWILFSLGNFVFNSPGRYQNKNVDPFSMVARLDLSRGRDSPVYSLRLYPIFSDNRLTNYQPRYLSEFEFLRAQELLYLHSPDKDNLEGKMRTGIDSNGRYLIIDVTPARYLRGGKK